MQVGRRGYDPVVSTSMANGMAKLGKRAWTRASLASDASRSAVSTNKMVCWSKKLEIICYHQYTGQTRGDGWVYFVCSGGYNINNILVITWDIPHISQLSLHCLPTSPVPGGAQTAAWCDWRTAQSQFSWKGKQELKDAFKYKWQSGKRVYQGMN